MSMSNGKRGKERKIERTTRNFVNLEMLATSPQRLMCYIISGQN